MDNEIKSPQQQLDETLMYRGFGTSLNRESKRHIDAGETEFQLVHCTKIGNDDISYQLYIGWSEEQKKFYLNKFDALLKPADKPGQQFLHTFYDREGITAKEAYNMLKYGEQTAVHKSMYKKGTSEKYNAWMNLDTTAPKDQFNNYPLNRYTDNYYKKQPFVLADTLQQLPTPIKGIENDKYLNSVVRSLQRGNAEQVTIMHNGQEQPGILLVNAKAGKVDVYDSQMQLIENKEQKAQQKEQVTETTTDDLKKKSGQQQVSWTKKDNRQGMRP